MYIVTRKHYIQKRHIDENPMFDHELEPAMVDAYPVASFHTRKAVDDYLRIAPGDEIRKLRMSGVEWHIDQIRIDTVTIISEWDGDTRYIRKFEATWL